MAGVGVEGVVERVRAYPLKSAAGAEVSLVRLEAAGVVGDRTWAALDPAGRALRAKEVPRLGSVSASVSTDGRLVLDVPGHGAGLTGPDAEAALTSHLSRPVWLRSSLAGYAEVAPVHVVFRPRLPIDEEEHGDGDGDRDGHGGSRVRANVWVRWSGDGVVEPGAGRRIRIGEAVVAVSRVPQSCPGVYAEVLQPGNVTPGAPAVLLD